MSVQHKSVLMRTNRVVVGIGKKLSWIYAVIVVISFYEVLMRYVFNRPTVWVHETSLALAAIAMIYGGLYAFAQDKHITISFVVDALPQKVQMYFKVFSDIVTMLYLILLSISTFTMTKQALLAPDGSIRLERSGSSWNSVLPAVVKLSMLATLVLFAITVAIHLWARVAARQKKH